jgi:glycosyltransferase involved in cell wall biosynthesis
MARADTLTRAARTQTPVAEHTVVSSHHVLARTGCELSILIPFHGDDPTPLATSLAAEIVAANADAELVLFDDGTPDPALPGRVADLVAGLPCPARLVVSRRNLGRSAARNALVRFARGAWLLFLDADMRIGPGFLARHLAAARGGGFDAAFGGYLADPPQDAGRALHAAIGDASGAHLLAVRRRIGATAFCTSNLLVRADIARAIPFDTGFTGWGWEDVDWALAASRGHRLVHIDNPAHHDGLYDTDELLARYRAAAANFARFLDKHPEASGLPSARAARLLGRIPGQRHLRRIWAGVARGTRLPIRLRILAVKLWRASWAAEAVGRARPQEGRPA